jgi:hypothetical protein
MKAGYGFSARNHMTLFIRKADILAVRSSYEFIFLGSASGLNTGSSMHMGQKDNEQLHPHPVLLSWSRTQHSHIGTPHPRQCVKAFRVLHILHKTVFPLFSNLFSPIL